MIEFLKQVKSNRFLKAVVPNLGELKFLAKFFLVFLIGFTFVQLFLYTGHTRAADSNAQGKGTTTTPGSYQTVSSGAVGMVTQTFAPWLLDCKEIGSAARTSGIDDSSIRPYQQCQSEDVTRTSGLMNQNMGIVGRLIKSETSMLQVQIANPAAPANYYASRVTGKTFAASPTSGNEVLAPMFHFSKAMQNLAYGAVVIILVISALSTLLSFIGNGEQKVTLIQLMVNTGITLFFITFFYQFGAIIYDLTVNYGNALVASTLEPYINAKIILERLQPGGDLNVSALLNVFEFSGVSQGVLTVANNVFYSIKPAIVQSVDAFTKNIATSLPLGSSTGYLFSIGGGVVSYLISGVISSVLGSTAIFDALIAFVIFSLNLKIWINLLTAFLSLNIYMGVGPLMMLNGISGGYDKIKNVFKTMLAYGLVFPMTFMFIMLGAIMMNFYIPRDYAAQKAGKTRDQSLLCVYATNDPISQEGKLAERVQFQVLGRTLGPGNNFYDDPNVFRRENTEFQDIYDVTPSYMNGEERSCRSNLFPDAFMFLPAPLGNYGNRLLQIQTTDILMRTIMAIAFLIIASRAPDILKELLKVEEMKSVQGMGSVFKAGLKPLIGTGSLGFSAGGPLLMGGGKLLLNTPLPFAGYLSKGLQRIGSRMQGGGPLNTASVSDLYGKFKGGYSYSKAASMYGEQVRGLTGAGIPAAEANLIAIQNMGQSFAKLSATSNAMADIFGSLTSSAAGLVKAFGDIGQQVGKITTVLSIDEL